jgi:hypothetical protein
MANEETELIAAKKLCREGETDDEHAKHADRLRAAYAAFAEPQESNPALPGETAIDAHVTVVSEQSV